MSLLAKILVALLALSGLAVVAAPPASASGTVTVQVTGKGDVSGDGIACQESGGPDCTQFYADDVERECDPDRKPPCITITTPPVVELVAGPDRSGYQYAGFTGCDAVSGRTCTLTVERSGTVSATFVDIEAPSVAIGAVPGHVRGPVTLSASASDNSGSVSGVVFWMGGVAVGSDSTAPYAVEVGTAAFPDGPIEVEAMAHDARGNASGASRTGTTIDNTAPVVTVTEGPDGSVVGPGGDANWSFEATDATSGVAELECSLVPAGSDPSFGACSDSFQHQADGLAEGAHVFQVRAVDRAGNAGTTVPRVVRVDATAPTTRIASGPRKKLTTRGSKAVAKFRLAASEPGTFRCQVDGGAWRSCAAVTKVKARVGKHVLKVAAADAVGNVDASPATYRWRVVRKR